MGKKKKLIVLYKVSNERGISYDVNLASAETVLNKFSGNRVKIFSEEKDYDIEKVIELCSQASTRYENGKTVKRPELSEIELVIKLTDILK